MTDTSSVLIEKRDSALWITLNRKLAGTHDFQITGDAVATNWLFLPLVMR